MCFPRHPGTFPLCEAHRNPIIAIQLHPGHDQIFMSVPSPSYRIRADPFLPMEGVCHIVGKLGRRECTFPFVAESESLSSRSPP